MKGAKKPSQPIKIFVLLVQRHPFYIALTIALLLLSSTFEGIGIAMLVPLLDNINGGGGESPIVAGITRALATVDLSPTLSTLITLVVCLVFFKAIFAFLANTIVGTVAARLEAGFRHRIIAAMIRARWRHFVSLPNGRVASAIGSEVNIATSCYIVITKLIASFAQVVVQLGVALLISWEIALGACILGGLIGLFGLRLVRMSRTMGQRRKDGVEMLSTRLLEALGGMKALKGMGAQDRMVPLLSWEIGNIRTAMRNLIVLGSALRSIPEPVAAIAIGTSLYYYLQHMDGELENFLVLALLLSRLIQSVAGLQHNYQRVVSCEPSFWFVEGIIAEAEAQEERGSGERPTHLQESISFDDICFDYGDHRVLDHVALTIEANTITAFAGPSGAGKTTLVDLVAGLHEPASGRILIDDVPLQEIDLQAWREHIGYVLQETFLFHESIKNNVTLGDDQLTADDAETALRKAGIWDFVAQLPDGMDTVVGERGARLSGGQRQRIAIARALVRKPMLLILDEPTVGLDRQTELEICETLSKLKGEVTTIAVSHQPALFGIADAIYAVSDGKVAPMAPEENGSAADVGDEVLSKLGRLSLDGTNG